MDSPASSTFQPDLKRYLILASILFIIFSFRVNQLGGFSRLPELSANIDQSTSDNNLWGIWRKSLTNRIAEFLPGDPGAILSGILIGQKSDLSVSLNKALKDTSTVHIVVVSGQNLSLVAGFIMLLAPRIGRRRTIVLASITVTFYALLTGFQVPVIRALIMVLLAFAAQIVGRERYAVRILLITAVVMVLYDPVWLFSISFQLSFLATFAVLVVAPMFETKLHFLPDLIRQDISVALSAQILTWPVVAYNFHQISLVGVIVNTLVLWTVPIIMILGAALVVLSVISAWLAHLISILPALFLQYFIDAVELGDRVPFSSLHLSAVSLVVFAGYYLILAGFLIYLYQSLPSQA